MEWYNIVFITLCAFWTSSTIIAAVANDETVVIPWACGLVYPVLYTLLYPIRAIKAYKSGRVYYATHNISVVQYLFGKRVHESSIQWEYIVGITTIVIVVLISITACSPFDITSI